MSFTFTLFAFKILSLRLGFVFINVKSILRNTKFSSSFFFTNQRNVKFILHSCKSFVIKSIITLTKNLNLINHYAFVKKGIDYYFGRKNTYFFFFFRSSFCILFYFFFILSFEEKLKHVEKCRLRKSLLLLFSAVVSIELTFGFFLYSDADLFKN